MSAWPRRQRAQSRHAGTHTCTVARTQMRMRAHTCAACTTHVFDRTCGRTCTYRVCMPRECTRACARAYHVHAARASCAQRTNAQTFTHACSRTHSCRHARSCTFTHARVLMHARPPTHSRECAHRHTHVCMLMRTCKLTHLRTLTCARSCTHTHARMLTYACACTHARTHAYPSTHTHTHARMLMQALAHALVCARTHARTHGHARTRTCSLAHERQHTRTCIFMAQPRAHMDGTGMEGCGRGQSRLGRRAEGPPDRPLGAIPIICNIPATYLHHTCHIHQHFKPIGQACQLVPAWLGRCRPSATNLHRHTAQNFRPEPQ